MPSLLSRLNTLSKSNRIGLLVFVVSAAICSGSWIVLKPAFVFDPQLSFVQRVVSDYQPQVQQFIDGQGITSFRYPPLLSVILALVYRAVRATGISDSVALAAYVATFTALGTVVMYRTARVLWGSLSALVVAFLWATYAPMLFSASYVGSETPFVLFFLLNAFFLVRLFKGQRSLFEYVGLGLATGAAMLTRPIAVGMPVLCVLSLWVALQRREGFRRFVSGVAIYLAIIIALVLPWEVYASLQLQRVIVLGTEDARSIVDGSTYAYALKYGRHAAVPDDVYEFQKDFNDQHFQTLGQIVSYLAGQMVIRPKTVLVHFLIKAANSWYRTDSNQYDNLILLVQIPYLLLFLVSIIMALRRKSLVRNVTWVVLLIVGYFWAMTTLVLSILRYMMPAIGLLFLVIPATALLWQKRSSNETAMTTPSAPV